MISRLLTRLAVLRIRHVVRSQMKEKGWKPVEGDDALWETPLMHFNGAESRQQIHESVCAAAMVKDEICNLYSKS